SGCSASCSRGSCAREESWRNSSPASLAVTASCLQSTLGCAGADHLGGLCSLGSVRTRIRLLSAPSTTATVCRGGEGRYTSRGLREGHQVDVGICRLLGCGQGSTSGSV